MNQMFNVLVEVLGIAILSAPLIWELWNDKNGDAHISRVDWNEDVQMLSKRVDIYARFAIVGVASMANSFLGHHPLQSIIMSGAIHFLLFDYLIVVVLTKNGVIETAAQWWDYLGSKGFDNFEWWKGKSWQVRMAIKIVVFIIACVIYF